jgi:flagellar hook-associated protein 2
VRIDQLARAEQRTYDPATIPKGPVTLDGVAIDLTGTTTAEEIAAKINGASGTPFAGVVNGSLVLTGRTLGKAIDFQDAGTATEIATTRTDAAQPTLYSVNGGPVVSTTDSVVRPGGLPGVELTLKDVGTTTLTITTPGVDSEKVKGKVKAFVDAYNATVDLVRGKLSEQKVKNPVSTADFTKGALRGDTALNGLLSNLRGLIQGPPDTTTAIDSLAELGVGVPRATTAGTPSPDALAGKLTFDGDKLAAALATSAADVRKLLGATNATTGAVMSDIGAAIEPIGKAATGYLARGAAAADSEASRMRARQEDVDRNLKLKEARLRSQFTALETALNQSGSQAGWIQGQIAGLPSWR